MSMSQAWTTEQPPNSSERKRVRRAVALAVWASVGVMALVLVVRRLGGGIERLPGASVAAVLTTLAAGASLGAVLLRRERAAGGALRQIAEGVVVLAPPFAMGLALLPTDSIAGSCYLAALFVATSAAFVGLGGAGRSHSGRLSAASRSSLFPFRPDCSGEKSVEASAETPADRPLQWMSRTIGADGREYVEGTAAVQFAAGQKQVAAHVAFCPPLAGPPEMEYEVLDGSDVRLKTGAVYPYGVRIEARRSGAMDREETVQVGYVACAEPGDDVATAGG